MSSLFSDFRTVVTSGEWCFWFKFNLFIPRVYSRDELLPHLQNCVDVLGNALDSPETERSVGAFTYCAFG